MTTDVMETTAFKLKGSLFTLTSMVLEKLDTLAIDAQLTALVAKTPKFFEQAPIVIDLQKMASLSVEVPFNDLLKIIRSHGLYPIGVRGGSARQHKAALAAGIAPLSTAKLPQTEPAPQSDSLISGKPGSQQPDAPATTNSPYKLITHPVRSGQQIYAKGADLIVTAPVSRGAEILADGNIHVYGALRGRALAGVQGDESAQIFCQTLDAELLSIAGLYSLTENLQAPDADAFVRIYIQDEQLKVAKV